MKCQRKNSQSQSQHVFGKFCLWVLAAFLFATVVIPEINSIIEESESYEQRQ